jgi:uncharacterized membrane protein HdeD (DUF308 family)
MSAASKTEKTGKRPGAKWELGGFLTIVGGICIYPASVNTAAALIAVGFVVFLVGRFKG